uniref:Target of myb1 like 2 membrane trafficking protein n=1 Tax=Myotis myotis TaxID=51298 RepID=A0A7J7RE53_MYOMY|nr:target of myb1 like 2 membrane trafficking protein [Myotis myotis]
MEFLLGNPFSTPVGQCLEKATDGSLQSEDWTLNMEICDIVNETEEGPKDAIRALKKRLNGNRNYREVMLALTVLETCVKNCGHRFHVLVASRDFIDGVLVRIISPKNNPPTIVQDKVLALIQAWADAFRSSPDLTGVVHIYEELKRKGVEFPNADLDALSPIHTPQRSVPEVDPAATVPRSQAQQRTSAGSFSSPPPPPFSAPQAPALSVTGPITANAEQIARLRSELDIVRGNTKVMSEMLTEMVPGQEDSSDLELLQELHRTCRAMQQRVVELISHVCNEEVTEELLRVNDDLNNVFLRYERFERFRSGRLVQNASNGVLSEVTEDNLIDLGPGSPAVVSPMVGSTAPPPSLSSQMAGHLSPPNQAPATPPVPSPTQSSVLRCCLHGNATVFAPRPPTSQDGLSGRWGSCSQRVPNRPPRSPHRFPHCLLRGASLGTVSALGLAPEQTLGLSLLWSLSSLSSEPRPRRPHSPHSAGRGEPRVWGGQPRPLDSGHRHLLSSCGIALHCSPTVCFPHAVPVWGVAREVSLC